jgi:hypothetical protein
VAGVDINQLPLEANLRKNIVRRYRAVLTQHKSSVIREQVFKASAFTGKFDIHFTPIFRNEGDKDIEAVLCMVGPFRGAEAWPSVLPAAPDGGGKRQRAVPKVKVKVKPATARSRKAAAGAKKNQKKKS